MNISQNYMTFNFGLKLTQKIILSTESYTTSILNLCYIPPEPKKVTNVAMVVS